MRHHRQIDNATMITNSLVDEQQQNNAYYEDEEPSGAFLGDAMCFGASCFESYREGNVCGVNTEYCSNGTYSNTAVVGDAFDIIIIESHEGNLYQNSPFLVNFPQKYSTNMYKIVLEIENSSENDRPGFSKAWFPVTSSRISERIHGNEDANDHVNDFFDERLFSSGICPEELSSLNETIATAATSTTSNEDGSNTESTNKLKLFLKHGRNAVRYLLLDQLMVVVGVAKANIFLWSHEDSVIISDIDGTITKSNTRGVIDTIVTAKYQHVHRNICNLLHQVASQPNTRVVYVTSRPLSLATTTRRFLDHVRQEDRNLPVGPILGFSGKFSHLLFMEMVTKTTHHFKSEILWQQVVRPFQRAKNTSDCKIFKAGFGNTIMDMQAYHAVGLELARMFQINKRSEIVAFDRLPMNATMDDTSYHNATTCNSTIKKRASLQFQPRRWFKDRMGSTYSGYNDPKLLALLIPPV
jgi:phosphatidate phosphatase PAH1